MVITNLQPETAYSVTVAAYTMKGDGARSKPKVAVTMAAGMRGPWGSGCTRQRAQRGQRGGLLGRAFRAGTAQPCLLLLTHRLASSAPARRNPLQLCVPCRLSLCPDSRLGAGGLLPFLWEASPSTALSTLGGGLCLTPLLPHDASSPGGPA